MAGADDGAHILQYNPVPVPASKFKSVRLPKSLLLILVKNAPRRLARSLAVEQLKLLQLPQSDQLVPLKVLWIDRAKVG